MAHFFINLKHLQVPLIDCHSRLDDIHFHSRKGSGSLNLFSSLFHSFLQVFSLLNYSLWVTLRVFCKMVTFVYYFTVWKIEKFTMTVFMVPFTIFSLQSVANRFLLLEPIKLNTCTFYPRVRHLFWRQLQSKPISTLNILPYLAHNHYCTCGISTIVLYT